MSWPVLVLLALVACQRVGELILDRKNTRALIAQGAEEYGAAHYPLFIILHGSWLLSLLVWALAFGAQLNWMLVALYLLLQAGRFWVLRTLGSFWTTRIISLPNVPLIKSGPYRYIRHPNYWIVVCEIAVLPLAMAAWPIAVLYSILNAGLLFHRIRIENAVLSLRR